MRIQAIGSLCQSHHIHDLTDFFLLLLFGIAELIDLQRLCDDISDGHSGVQRCVGILENDLHILAKLFQLRLGHVRDILSLKDNPAACSLMQVQDHPAQCRLSAAGFSHDPQRLSLPQTEGDAIHCMECPLFGGKILCQVFYS